MRNLLVLVAIYFIASVAAFIFTPTGDPIPFWIICIIMFSLTAGAYYVGKSSQK
jgi:general stress protein CsbA